MHFRSYALPDSSFHWEFGDGTASTDSVPSHVYTDTGTYTVKLTVNGHAATACSTTLAIINPPASTSAMGGIRTWHDTTYTYKDHEVATPQADEAFPIVIIQSSTNPI